MSEKEAANGVESLSLEENPASQHPTEEDDDYVDPWTVTSKSDAGIDYDKLISKSASWNKR